jgi:hypothetical protein
MDGLSRSSGRSSAQRSSSRSFTCSPDRGGDCESSDKNLPSGLQKRLVPVPPPLIARLQPLPSHFNRFFAGHDLIVVDTRTNAVVAVISRVY